MTISGKNTTYLQFLNKHFHAFIYTLFFYFALYFKQRNMINPFNFTELMCEVDAIADLNTKQFFLHEARAIYEQTVISTTIS